MSINRSELRSKHLPYVLSLVGGLALLEVFARILDKPYFPTASGVFSRLISLFAEGEFRIDLSRSLQNLFLGFLIACISGITIGILCGRYSLIEHVLRPYINTMVTAPSILFVPIYFVVFGVSRWAIVALIVDYAVFFLIISTTTAVRSVDREIVEMSKVFGASERQRMRLILLPSATPLIFAALRIALARAIKGMINGELLIAVVGLGSRSQNFARAFDAEGVFAVASLVVTVALVLGALLSFVDGRVNSWVPDIRRKG